jgi:vacuolar-type H+-ATPase subunit E/Vma4
MSDQAPGIPEQNLESVFARMRAEHRLSRRVPRRAARKAARIRLNRKERIVSKPIASQDGEGPGRRGS